MTALNESNPATAPLAVNACRRKPFCDWVNSGSRAKKAPHADELQEGERYA